MEPREFRWLKTSEERLRAEERKSEEREDEVDEVERGANED
jgi:hypothetical protein